MDYKDTLKELAKNLVQLTMGAGHGVPIKLLQAVLLTVLATHEREKENLERLEIKLDMLLGVDVKAGYELLNRSSETLSDGRSAELAAEDIRSAQLHFTRALSVTTNELEQAMVRHKIGVCAFLLEDHALARREFKQAYMLARQWRNALRVSEQVERRYRNTKKDVENWENPKTIGNWIWRILLPDMPSGIGSVRQTAGIARKDYEDAQKHLELKKAEINLFLEHIREISREVTSLKLNLDS
jgi:hypothetical protein